MGDHAEAARLARESARLAPNDAAGQRTLSRALAELARTQSGAPRTSTLGEAIDAANEAARLDPSNPNSHLVRAEALAIAGDTKRADAAVQLAIRSAPNSVATWVTASLVALRARNWVAAIAACHRALAIDANNYAALNNLGVALRASGRGREGSEALARAARVSPDDPTARRNLSRAGIRTARIVVMVVLIPISILLHLGFVLYWVVGIGSNILISRRPDLVLRVERWAVPIALFVARRPGWRRAHAVAADESPAETPDLHAPQWSATQGRPRLSYRLLFILAICTCAIAVVMIAIAASAPEDVDARLAFGALALPFAAVTFWLAIVLSRRRARA
jgi:Tfp pilus assembly protein PilF